MPENLGPGQQHSHKSANPMMGFSSMRLDPVTNNWLLDGISVSDVQHTGPISRGIPIPNPDMLEEFKVQTGLPRIRGRAREHDSRSVPVSEFIEARRRR